MREAEEGRRSREVHAVLCCTGLVLPREGCIFSVLSSTSTSTKHTHTDKHNAQAHAEAQAQAPCNLRGSASPSLPRNHQRLHPGGCCAVEVCKGAGVHKGAHLQPVSGCEGAHGSGCTRAGAHSQQAAGHGKGVSDTVGTRHHEQVAAAVVRQSCKEGRQRDTNNTYNEADINRACARGGGRR